MIYLKIRHAFLSTVVEKLIPRIELLAFDKLKLVTTITDFYVWQAFQGRYKGLGKCY
jgi:hypothetical protein